MDVTQQAITVRDLVSGFKNDPDHGVQAMACGTLLFFTALFFVQLFASSDSHKHERPERLPSAAKLEIFLLLQIIPNLFFISLKYCIFADSFISYSGRP